MRLIKNRQRFLSEHLELYQEIDNNLENEPPSPKIQTLKLQDDLILEEIRLSGDEETVSKNTDFSIDFSKREGEKTAETTIKKFCENRLQLKAMSGSGLIKKRSNSFTNSIENVSLNDFLQNNK